MMTGPQFAAGVRVEDQRKRKPKLRALAQCHESWKAQQSAPFVFRGRTFDVVPGSIELSTALYELLRDCLLGHVHEHVIDRRLEEIDAQEDAFGLVAKLEAAHFGPLQSSERDGVTRAQRAPGSGWRHGKSSPVEVQDETFDCTDVAEELLLRTGAKRIVALDEGARSHALYHVLRRIVLTGEAISSKAEVLQRTDALARALADSEGVFPETY